MIHGIGRTIQEDTSVLIKWCKGEDLDLQAYETIDQRVQLAAFRMLAVIAMFFGTLWALQILTFVVTFPVTVVLKLATAIGIYALAHDAFIMCQNYYHHSLKTHQEEKPTLWNYFFGKAVSEEEQASEFTHGTFLQPLYMWVYVNRDKIPVPEQLMQI